MRGALKIIRRRLRRLFASLRTLGVRETAKAVVRKLFAHHPHKEGRKFDQRYGIETNTIVRTTELGVSELARRGAYDYVPIGYEVFRRILRSLGENLSDYVFVDLGSGKGRAVLLAAQLPFRRVLGVEISENLHQTAIENLRIFRSRNSTLVEVELIRSDAAHYPGTGEDTIYYMYHPFHKSIVDQVLGNLKRSISNNPHRILVVSVGQSRHIALSESDFLHLREDHDIYVRDWSWAVYESWY